MNDSCSFFAAKVLCEDVAKFLYLRIRKNAVLRLFIVAPRFAYYIMSQSKDLKINPKSKKASRGEHKIEKLIPPAQMHLRMTSQNGHNTSTCFTTTYEECK